MLLVLLSLCSFAANISGRYLDPLVTSIARDFVVPVGTAALLSSAFTLPFGLSQPFLGPIGDAVGKARVFKTCFWLLGLSLLLSVVANSFPLLFASRMLAGFAAGGIIPLGLAMLGDALPPSERQIGFARFSSSAVVGQILGLTAGGALIGLFGWRHALLFPATLATGAALAATIWLPVSVGGPPIIREPRTGSQMAGTLARYGLVFRNPKAPVCFATAFAEGVFVYGAVPFIVILLEADGRGGPREAGLIIAAMGVGCVLMTAVVRPLLHRIGPDNMMRYGGLVAAAGLGAMAAGADWWKDAVLFVAIGFGFFMIHNSLQNRVMELAPEARGSAVALHYFSFFLGQAVGPLVFGLTAAHAGAGGAFLLNATAIGATGFLAVALLRSLGRAEPPPPV